MLSRKTDLDLAGKIVVLTGASSGIGRAAAILFAREKANLVLASRGREVLEEVRAECEQVGARVLVVPTDISEASQVKHLANLAAGRFGGCIDIWINDPGIGAIGHFEDIPIEAHDQVIKTNLLGYMHGAHAVLPYFKRQGQGILINLLSIAAFLPTPFAASYGASKFGLRAFFEALRSELKEFPNIKICDICPSTVDTPAVSDRAANYSGARMDVTKFGMPPERVARAVLECAKRPRRRILLGFSTPIGRWGYAIAPRLTLDLLAFFMKRHMETAAPMRRTNGAVLSEMPDTARVRGSTGRDGSSIEDGRRSSWKRASILASLGVAAFIGTLALRKLVQPSLPMAK